MKKVQTAVTLASQGNEEADKAAMHLLGESEEPIRKIVRFIRSCDRQPTELNSVQARLWGLEFTVICGGSFFNVHRPDVL